MLMTKKLEKLLAKYKKANRARLNAYARRSRALGGTINQNGTFSNEDGHWKRLFPNPAADELEAKLNADIETARLHKLDVSAEIRAYCKQRKLHIQWGSSNQINKVLTHFEWQLRRWPQKKSALTLILVMRQLKLTKKELHYF